MGGRRKKLTDKHGLTLTNTDKKQRTEPSVPAGDRPCASLSDSALVANAALSLLNLCCHLLDRNSPRRRRLLKKKGVLRNDCIASEARLGGAHEHFPL